MKRGFRSLVALLLLTVMWGCVTAPPAGPLVPTPLFQATSEEAKELAAIASEVRIQAMDCTTEGRCDDRILFMGALASLFENREAAGASFEQVMHRYPTSPYAKTSVLWLQLLKTNGLSVSSDDPQQRLLRDLTAQSVRELAGRQQSDRANQPTPGGRDTTATIQALSKQVQTRDRRIAELRSQLDALKVIDQDHQERHRMMRAPTSHSPKGESR